MLEVEISDANLCAPSNGIVLNGGSMQFLNGLYENNGNGIIPITVGALARW